jgi:sterol desaturase/sphingolipid hydroxylase (fatty acid hydroxylase superfamily)
MPEPTKRFYISNKNESVPMFESRFMEFFSHVHPATPVVLYVPVIVYLLYRALAHGQMSALTVIVLFLIGVLMWTLLEYVVHRYVFHYEPKSRAGKALHFIIHGVHHDYPNDASRLVLPPVISLPMAVLFYFLFAVSFGRFAPAISAGFGAGYVCYDMIHYATHHFVMKNRIGLWLKQYHLRHHYKDDEVGFGVSSPLWDYIFGTTRK